MRIYGNNDDYPDEIKKFLRDRPALLPAVASQDLILYPVLGDFQPPPKVPGRGTVTYLLVENTNEMCEWEDVTAALEWAAQQDLPFYTLPTRDSGGPSEGYLREYLIHYVQSMNNLRPRGGGGVILECESHREQSWKLWYELLRYQAHPDRHQSWVLAD